MKDSSGEALQGVLLRLLCSNDTLRTFSDQDGGFIFSSVRCLNITLLVSSFGYTSFKKGYLLKSDQRVTVIEPVILTPESEMLDEMIIHKKTPPLTFKKDTIEYDAAAFSVRETDRVEDLLKQLPGVEIDKDGNVTSLGKALTKLRVNGKDFFTNDIKEYIRQLPADMVARLQVVDDYGDKAGFTGIKLGEPQKMLNLITKKGRDRVDFLNANASAGTDSRYVAAVNASRWRNSKQIAFNSGINNVNSGAGINNTASLSANYRDKWGEHLTGSISYYYSGNRSKMNSTSLSETSSSQGTIYNNISAISAGRYNYHNLNAGVNTVGNKKDLLEAALSIGLADNSGVNNTVSSQTGLIRQDLTATSTEKKHSPNVNVSASWAHSFSRKRRVASVGCSVNAADNRADNDIINQIGYYDGGLPVKDSLERRMINTGNRIVRTGANFSFSETAGNNSDIYLTYLFSGETNNNRLITAAAGEAGIDHPIDSLSSSCKYSFTYHQAALNYRYNYKKLNYSVGIGVQPGVLSGHYEAGTEKINKREVDLIPLFNLNYLISGNSSLSFNYRTSNKVPDFLQLQPVRDTRNVQNTTIGNPDLKAAFVHTTTVEFRIADPQKSTSFQSGLTGNFTRNQVVTNVLLIPDTLNGFRQETRYLNANGIYSLSGWYSWFTFLKEKVLSLELQGNLSCDQSASFTDNSRHLNKNLIFSQSARFYYNKPWAGFNTRVVYERHSNKYSLTGGRNTEISSWLFNLDGKVYFLKTYSGGVNTSLRASKGYKIAVPNPVILNVFMEKWFSKKKRAGLRLSVNDLFNQGTGFSRNITDNSITDTRTNQVKRYFLLGCTFRLQNTPIKAITLPAIAPLNQTIR